MRIVVSLLIGLFSANLSVQAEGFKVAADASAITPPVGTYLAGYGADRKSTGLFDDVWVKVVVIEAGSETVALVTIDCIGLTRPHILRIQAGVQNQLPNVHVVVSSTHTHAGPDVVGIWGPAFWRSGRDEAYIDGLVSTAIELVVQTANTVQPATSRVASMDMPMPWVENVSERDLLDARLAVLQFVSVAGETIATLTNYACHPTVLGPDNTMVSADYVDGFYRQMAENLAGEHLFLQGAIGGWVQPVQGDRSKSLALQLGISLADAALAALSEADDNAYAPLQFASRSFDVPLDNWGFRLLIWLGVLERELYDGAMRTSVAWFQIGQAQFVTHPGETSPAYSLASRDLLDARHSFVLGLTQDAMGYILKPEYFADDVEYPHGSYLTSVSAGAEAGPRVMAALKEILP
jgi:hypothetical protein